MPIVQAGSINTTAIVVPDLYVQIVSPQNLVLNGVPSNVLGVVGTATWGPVNQATVIGSSQACTTTFGAVQNRLYDIGTHVAIAAQQGASSFKCVRVTDGTDVAAALVIGSTCITFTAKYTGTLGNSIAVTIGTGTKASTTSVSIAIPGQVPEFFNNIAGTGNALWVAIAFAINNGTTLRGASNILTAAAGSGTTAPTAGSQGAFSGGLDGATTITASVLCGSDSATPRTGMYALRGQGCALLDVCDMSTAASWPTIDAFAQSEGIYAIQTTPSGDTISTAVSAKGTNGLDSYSSKLLFGDWIYWLDTVNQVVRLVSPQPFAAGRLANLSPEQSGLNKPLAGVLGSQKSGSPTAPTQQVYAAADLSTLFQAGIDVISNPQPGGQFWGLRLGHNSSSNAAVNGDNYTRLTNYIASTLAAGMGLYVGQVINATLLQNISATLNNFLQNMLNAGQLGSVTGAQPWSVVCNAQNNPQSQTSLGYVIAAVNVQYQGINEKFIVNLQGGQTVQVSSSIGTYSSSGQQVAA